MSQDVDREKVLQTTKVRTSIKSDLSWIQKTKKAEEQDSSTKESTVPTEEGTSPTLRQLSYVLMTAKKFESATSPPLSPTEVTSLKQPETENGLQNGKHSDPVSPEPTAASTTAEEKYHAELPESNDSAEVSTKVEEIIVNDTSVEEPGACTVPDILAESAFKSPPPPENGNEVPEATALDILSESLVEPILNINPTSEIAADQNVLDLLSDTLVRPILNVDSSSETAADQNTLDTLNLNKPVTAQTCDETVEVTDLPQDCSASTETQSNSTNENIVSETTAELTIVQNNTDPAKGEGSEKATEVPKEVSAISSDADVPQDNETPLLSREHVVGTESFEIIPAQNNVNPVITTDEAAASSELPKPEIPASVSDEPQENAEPNKTQSTKEDVVEPVNGEINPLNEVEPVKANEEVTEVPKEPEIPVIVADAPQESSEPDETQSTKVDVVRTENGEIVQNEIEPVKVSEEVTEGPEIPAIITNVPEDNVDHTATPDVVETGTTNTEEQKASDITAISSDTDSLSVSLSNEETSTNVDSTITQDNVADQDITEEVLSETKEATVDQNSTVQESKITEVVDAEMPCPTKSTTAESAQDNVTNELAQVEIVVPDNTSILVDPESTAQTDEEKTPAKESPENSNTVGTADETPVGTQSTIETGETITNESESTAHDVEEKLIIPEKEIVIDKIPAQENTLIIESEQKQTTEDPVVCTETLADPPKENVEDLNKVEVQASLETPEVAENVETAAESSLVPAEINQDEIFKAEPVVVVSSPESLASEVGESSPLKNITEETSEDTLTETTIKDEVESAPVISSVASENQAALDISDALDIVTNSEQSKKEEGEFEKTDALGKATVDTTVNGFEEPKNSSEEKQPTDNISVPSSEEKEETSSFIMRDGKEVCSHCDQFIGLIKLTVSYPPKYLHPECLLCGECTMILGDLLTPMFVHNQVIYCSECYDKVYGLF